VNDDNVMGRDRCLLMSSRTREEANLGEEREKGMEEKRGKVDRLQKAGGFNG
jgi:hypothetical protein